MTVTVHGVSFPSYAAAGRAYGVSGNAVRIAALRGTLHRVGTGRVGAEPMPIRINGQNFASAHDAARHFGCTPHAIWKAVADGDPDRIARARTYNGATARPYRIGALCFPSMREASRRLGFESPDFISGVERRNSRQGREKIIAAAMRYQAQNGVGGA